jgi:hypothetical protein
MTTALPKLAGMPPGLVLDGELVAWRDSAPHFPLVCRRIYRFVRRLSRILA